ncbi:hypothetical protein MNBD_DELTA02-781 [hydrothermal vent metagenome]|uniref:Flagellar hook-length control protein-like C-terminal domain-containing protein n=1 Tax=hydrothermal vent metagenome TaxID=652676 RepID=A0A3B0UU35_9ZZZZ
MGNIFTTNSSAERFFGAQQRASARTFEPGARGAERGASVFGGTSNAEFFKARADARALERAGDNNTLRSPAIEDSPKIVSERPAKVSERPAKVSERPAKASERPAKASSPAGDSAYAANAYESPSGAAELSTHTRAAGEESRIENIEDSNEGADGSASRAGEKGRIEKAVLPGGSLQSGESLSELAKSIQPGATEPGPLIAGQNRSGTGKKVDVSPGKAAGAYETVAAALDNKGAAVLSGAVSGESADTVNANGGVYTSESAGEGAQGVIDAGAVPVEGAALTQAGAGEPETDAGILEDKAGAGRSEKSGAPGGVGNGAQEAGKGANAPSAPSAAGVTSLQAAYVEGRTGEEGAGKKDGEGQVTKKTSKPSSKNTASQRVAPPGGEQADIPVEELESGPGEVADSAKLVEAVKGKEEKGAVPGFTKVHGAGAAKPDAAVVKNDGKAEGMVQAKDLNTGVESAKKTAAAPKAFTNFGKLQEGVFSAVDRGVRLSLASGGQDAKLTLRPESLGELRIKLSIGEDGQVQSKIMVDNATVKGILNNDAARLKGIFSEQGLDLESYSVEVGSGWSGQSAGGDGSGSDLNGRRVHRAYSKGFGGAMEMDTFLMAERAYGAAGGGLDLFA